MPDSFQLSADEISVLAEALSKDSATSLVELSRLSDVLVAKYRLHSGDALAPTGQPRQLVIIGGALVHSSD